MDRPRAAAAGRMGATDCERLRPGPVAQPANTVTSFAYVAAAALVHQRHGRRRSVTAYWSLLALVGFGSVAFHGPQPPGAGLLHDVPIPALLGVVAATPAVHFHRGWAPFPGWSATRGVVLMGSALAAGACYLAGRTGSRTCSPDSPWQLHGAWHILSAGTFVVAAEILHGTRP